MQSQKILIGMGAMLIAMGGYADWVQIDLDKHAHGEVLNGAKTGPATLDAYNFHHPDGRLVAFDTRQRGTRDPDIEGPNDQDGQWATGNVPPDNVMGTVLVLQSLGDSFAGYTDSTQTAVAEPDVEDRERNGSRPGAGEVAIELDRDVFAFRFSLLNVQQNEAFEDRIASYVIYAHGSDEVKIAFADLIDPDSAYYDPSIRFGDGSANRLPVITAGQLGLPGIDRVVINLAGSGAIGGLSYIEEEPGDIGLTQEIALRQAFGSSPFNLFLAGANQGNPYTDGPPGGPGGPGGPSPNPPPRDPDDTPDPPTAVPTPGAGLAGGLLISLLAAKRPRRKTLTSIRETRSLGAVQSVS